MSVTSPKTLFKIDTVYHFLKYLHCSGLSLKIRSSIKKKLHFFWHKHYTKLQIYSILMLANATKDWNENQFNKFLLDDSRISVIAPVILCCFFKGKKIQFLYYRKHGKSELARN